MLSRSEDNMIPPPSLRELDFNQQFRRFASQHTHLLESLNYQTLETSLKAPLLIWGRSASRRKYRISIQTSILTKNQGYTNQDTANIATTFLCHVSFDRITYITWFSFWIRFVLATSLLYHPYGMNYTVLPISKFTQKIYKTDTNSRTSSKSSVSAMSR